MTKPKEKQIKTEEKFLTAKDLAKMANVEPRQLRRCLRTHFAGRITATKGDNGMKTYQIKAKDPIVKEILAKLKGNGDKGKATKPVKAQAGKGDGDEPSPPALLARLDAALRTPDVLEEPEEILDDKTAGIGYNPYHLGFQRGGKGRRPREAMEKK